MGQLWILWCHPTSVPRHRVVRAARFARHKCAHVTQSVARRSLADRLILTCIDAPFGRFLPAQHSIIHFTLPGNPGWFLMEIFAPLSFIRAFLTPITTTVSRTTGTTPLVPLSAVASLPAARLILAAAFLAHYSNRAVLDPLVRNPARARMAWYVILLGALFNVANGTLLGRWVAGGLLDDSTSQRIAEPARELGLQSGVTMKVLFAVGMAVWALGFAGNIYHDRILYAIKRDKMRQQKQIEKVKSTADGRQQTAEDSKQRYAIPRGGLYEYVSHPSYSTEWFEWTGGSQFPLILCTCANLDSNSLSRHAQVSSLRH